MSNQTPRTVHKFVQDSGFAIARDRAAARRGTDGNLAQVQKEAQQQAATPGAKVIAYEQSEEEKMNVPMSVDGPNDDEDDDEPSDEVKGLVVQLVGSMGKLARVLVTDGIKPSTKPVATGGKPSTVPPAQPYRATAADIRDAQIAGAGKAVDGMNARVTDGTDPLKEAGFDVPLHYQWDPISARYRIS